MQIPWSDDSDAGPTWSADGTRLYLARAGGSNFELRVSSFDGTTFAPPTMINDANLAGVDLIAPAMRSDELELY